MRPTLHCVLPAGGTGVTVIWAITTEPVAFRAVKAGSDVPVPEAARPMEVLSLVHSKVVPGAKEPVKLTPLRVPPAHTTWLGIGLGWSWVTYTVTDAEAGDVHTPLETPVMV
ncbi:hypothetical protein GCM10023184_47600 [Flaviaesturariibacter amylovorans]|uniref:Uncharacterized protein n=1 Tax=Flaviaesturariibacter amylovorans TaxID=1084520 RepID=A0ABP8HW31_9BACT